MTPQNNGHPEEATRDATDTVDDRYRARLHELQTNPSLSTEAKIQRMLELGRARFGVENGHVVWIDQDEEIHEVRFASGSSLVTTGAISQLGETFCRKTITSDGLLAVYDAAAEGWSGDPAEQWGIACYLGGKIVVEDELFGTLCFVDREPRREQFTDQERAFMEILTRWITQLFDAQRHERRLREQQEKFDLLVDAVDDYAIFMLDAEGMISTWNTGARHLKGYHEEEIIGQPYAQLFPLTARQAGRPEQLLAQARESGYVEGEGWRVRKDGTKFWALATLTAFYDEEGTLTGYGKITRDLTERRAARQALEAERMFTQRALDALEDIFFVINPDGEIERINEPALDVLGISEAEALTMDPTAFFDPGDREAVTTALVEAFDTGRAAVRATIVTADGERIPYEFRGRRINGPDGEVFGIAGIGRDVTAQLLNEQRLEVAQRVLRHNVRNQLNVIRGWAESLAADGGGVTGTQQIIRAADQLLDLSRKSEFMAELDSEDIRERTAFDIGESVRALATEFASAHPTATVTVDLAPDLGTVTSNERLVLIAIEHLLENAVEHNPNDSPWVRVEVERDDELIVISVLDDGPGVPQTEQRVLERGTETPLEHGSGLGLWIVNWCASSLRGTVRLEERRPTGSCVTLELPDTA